jgi:tetratricopeptide (TPR) repeat protein
LGWLFNADSNRITSGEKITAPMALEPAPGKHKGSAVILTSDGSVAISSGSLSRNYWRAGKEWYDKGKYEDADKALSKVIQMAPNSPDAANARRLLGNIRLLKGKLQVKSKSEKAAAVTVKQQISAGNTFQLDQQSKLIEGGQLAAQKGDTKRAQQMFQAAEALGTQLVAKGESSFDQSARLRGARQQLKIAQKTSSDYVTRGLTQVKELRKSGRIAEAGLLADKLAENVGELSNSGAAGITLELQKEREQLAFELVKTRLGASHRGVAERVKRLRDMEEAIQSEGERQIAPIAPIIKHQAELTQSRPSLSNTNEMKKALAAQHLKKAKIMLNDGNAVGSVSEFKSAITLDPTLTDAKTLMGLATKLSGPTGGGGALSKLIKRQTVTRGEGRTGLQTSTGTIQPESNLEVNPYDFDYSDQTVKTYKIGDLVAALPGDDNDDGLENIAGQEAKRNKKTDELARQIKSLVKDGQVKVTLYGGQRAFQVTSTLGGQKATADLIDGLRRARGPQVQIGSNLALQEGFGQQEDGGFSYGSMKRPSGSNAPDIGSITVGGGTLNVAGTVGGDRRHMTTGSTKVDPNLQKFIYDNYGWQGVRSGRGRRPGESSLILQNAAKLRRRVSDMTTRAKSLAAGRNFAAALEETKQILILDPNNRWARANMETLQNFVLVQNEKGLIKDTNRETNVAQLDIRRSETPWHMMVNYPKNWNEITTKRKPFDSTTPHGKPVGIRITLKNAKAASVAESLTQLFASKRGAEPNDRVTVVAEGSSNNIIVTANPKNLETVRELLGELDEAAFDNSIQVRVVPLKNTDAATVASIVSNLYEQKSAARGNNRSIDRVMIQADKRTNALIVSAGGQMNTQVMEWIKQIDAKPKPHDAPSQAETEMDRVVRKQLDTRVSKLDFEDMEISQVFQFLRDVSGANIHVKWRVLDAAGVEPQTSVNVHLSNKTFRQSLESVLKAVRPGGKGELDYVIDEGVITISTKSDLGNRTIVRVYDIRDMITKVPMFEGPRIGRGVSTNGTETGLFDPGASAGGGDLEGDLKSRTEEIAEIKTLIADTVSRDSWRDAGGNAGAISEIGGQLVITQTRENQESIVDLIGKLRKARAVKSREKLDPEKLARALQSNRWQKTQVASLNLNVDAAAAGSLGVKFHKGNNDVSYTVVDEAQFRTLMELDAARRAAANGDQVGANETRQDTIVGTDALLANSMTTYVTNSRDRSNTLDIGDNPINLSHEKYVLIDNNGSLTAVRAGAMQHWREASKYVEFVKAPQTIEIPRIGELVRLEKTLVKPGDEMVVRFDYQWKGR